MISGGTAYGEKQKPTGFILWGGETGYDWSRRSELKLNTLISQSPTIADLNKDGFPGSGFLRRGQPSGGALLGNGPRNLQPESSFLAPGPALLHGGGRRLECRRLVGHDRGRRLGFRAIRPADPTHLHPLGSREGYSEDRILRLEGYDPLEHAVADLNRDGFLDIVTSNYHAYFTRSIPAFIYWGSAEGSYSESRRSHLPAESSGALTVADLNQDGWYDIAVFNHLDRGDHGAGTYIYWGGPQGYSADRRHWIQTFGPHFGRPQGYREHL